MIDQLDGITEKMGLQQFNIVGVAHFFRSILINVGFIALLQHARTCQHITHLKA